MMLLLHGAIRFFVISCSANIYKPFLNWRIRFPSEGVFNSATFICIVAYVTASETYYQSRTS